MINQKNVELGRIRSSIRELFEYGKKRKAEIGGDKVFDFSIGNPSVPAPAEVHSALKEIIEQTDPVTLHSYTSAQGDLSVRKTLADYINKRFGTSLTADCLYMTCGAAASLTIVMNALLNKDEEIITVAPYFPEYKVFAEHAGGKLVAVDSADGTFQLDLNRIEAAINCRTKAVLINSPNNPSGVVYNADDIKRLAQLLERYSQKFGNAIYLISDEPYRELVFDKTITVPYIMNYYPRSIVCYSYSKSLSLPGERIGYVAVNPAMEEADEVYAGVCGAGRALGFVCAPSLLQQLVKRCANQTSDFSVYVKNRDLLMRKLGEYGFEFVPPDGAFYLFVKSPDGCGASFAERAKSFEILLVDGAGFGCKEYVRLSYCVSEEMLERSLPAFKALAESYV